MAKTFQTHLTKCQSISEFQKDFLVSSILTKPCRGSTLLEASRSKRQDLPKLGLFLTNLVKTALIYSVVTIHLGLCPRIREIIYFVNFWSQSVQIPTWKNIVKICHLNCVQFSYYFRDLTWPFCKDNSFFIHICI